MRRVAAMTFLLTAACGGESPEVTPDSTAAAPSAADLSAVRTLRDSAEATLATLGVNVTFDSVVVVQPPHDGTRLPAMAVCGRILGITGRPAPARFVYQSKWTVFVEEESNRAAFADLWARTCAADGATIVIPS
jgi:hypothetical protein